MFHTCTASRPCGYSGASSGCTELWNICHILYKNRASRPCGFSCGSPRCSSLWNIFHILYRNRASLPCGFSCGPTRSCSLWNICHILYRNRASRPCGPAGDLAVIVTGWNFSHRCCMETASPLCGPSGELAVVMNDWTFFRTCHRNKVCRPFVFLRGFSVPIWKQMSSRKSCKGTTSRRCGCSGDSLRRFSLWNIRHSLDRNRASRLSVSSGALSTHGQNQIAAHT